MAKFRDLSQSYKTEDRSIGDRQRHYGLVREQIRSNLPAMLEELDIISATLNPKDSESNKRSINTYDSRKKGLGSNSWVL